jgi:hypothetical protein
MKLTNALMPGRVMSEPLPEIGAAPVRAAPVAAPQKKRGPLMNALSAVFEYGAPEAFQAGRDRRTQKELGNMLASGDVAGAGKYAYQRGALEMGDAYSERATQMGADKRKQEAQGVVTLFSQGPQFVNQFAMEDPAGFESQTGMTAEEYLQAAGRFGDGGQQFAQFALQKAQAELGQTPAGPAEGKVVNNRLVNPVTGEVLGDYSDPATRFRPLTAEEAQRFGLPSNSGYQVNETTGEIKSLGRENAAAVNVFTGDGGGGARPIIDKPPKDYQAVWDEEAGTYRMEPIPGSATARELEQGVIKADARQKLSDQQFAIVETSIDRALEQADGWSAGLMAQATSGIGSTPARNLRATLDTVVANLGFDKLQEMREMSPTGGALGAVTERELQFLQSVRGSLDQIQSPEQLRNTLRQIKQSLQILQEIRRLNTEATVTNSGERVPTGNVGQTNQTAETDDLDSLLGFMTPEQRALFEGNQ